MALAGVSDVTRRTGGGPNVFLGATNAGGTVAPPVAVAGVLLPNDDSMPVYEPVRARGGEGGRVPCQRHIGQTDRRRGPTLRVTSLSTSDPGSVPAACSTDASACAAAPPRRGNAGPPGGGGGEGPDDGGDGAPLDAPDPENASEAAATRPIAGSACVTSIPAYAHPVRGPVSIESPT